MRYGLLQVAAPSNGLENVVDRSSWSKCVSLFSQEQMTGRSEIAEHRICIGRARFRTSGAKRDHHGSEKRGPQLDLTIVESGNHLRTLSPDVMDLGERAGAFDTLSAVACDRGDPVHYLADSWR